MRPFGRVVTAAIGQAGANGAALLGFRTGFDVKYTGTGTPGHGEVKVWNVPREIISAAFAGPLPSCMVTAGHFEADTGVPLPALPLLNGDVTDYTIESDGIDSVLVMQVISAGFAWQRARFVFTAPSASSYTALVPLAVAQAGLVMRTLVPAQDVPLPLGAYEDGPFRRFMDRAADAMGASWRVADGRFVDVWPRTLPNPTAFAAVFDPTNTIGQPKLKGKKIEIRGLLNGKVRPGSSFTVIRPPNDPVGAGTYVATDVAFRGDSGFSPDFYVDIVGKIPGT